MSDNWVGIGVVVADAPGDGGDGVPGAGRVRVDRHYAAHEDGDANANADADGNAHGFDNAVAKQLHDRDLPETFCRENLCKYI